MSLRNLLWAILPSTLEEVVTVYDRHLSRESADIAAIEARIGRPLSTKPTQYERSGSVAVLPIEGVIFPKANLLTEISGGQSAQLLREQVNAAAADTAVRSILLVIDSPGGATSGIPELAHAIRSAGKPVTAISDGVMASAAYWIASAADAVYTTGPTVQVGSIGVYSRMSWSAHSDNSLELVRGKYKRLAINGQSPNAEVLQHYEGLLDQLYVLFVDTVAKHRGTSTKHVLDKMADGRIFMGQSAIDVGLVDGFLSVEEAIERMNGDPAAFKRRSTAPQRAPAATSPTIAAASPSAPAPAPAPIPHFILAKLATPAPATPAPAPAPPSKHEQVAIAKRYALEKGCSFVDALKRLGFAA